MIKCIRLFILLGIAGGVVYVSLGALCATFSGAAYAQAADKSEGTTFVGRGGKVTITDKHGAQVVEGIKVRPVNKITTVPPTSVAPAEDKAAASTETPATTETTTSTEAKPAETTPTEVAKPDDKNAKPVGKSAKPGNDNAKSDSENEKKVLEDANKPVSEKKAGESQEPSKDPSAKSGNQKKKEGEAAPALSPEEAKKKAAAQAADRAATKARKQKDAQKLNSIMQTGGWFYTKDGKAISNEEMADRIKKGKVEDIKAIDIYEEQYETGSSKVKDNEKGKTKSKATK